MALRDTTTDAPTLEDGSAILSIEERAAQRSGIPTDFAERSAKLLLESGKVGRTNVFQWTEGKTVYTARINDMRQRGNSLAIDVDLYRDGEELRYSKPWVLGGAPMLVPDPTGPIVKYAPVGTFVFGQRRLLKEVRFRFDPFEALKDVMLDQIKGLVRAIK